ncbi:MAG: ATP-grasp enzyme [Gomphosphaeria aponina SAG 52.96 = DSM 107014]|uniref:ATP-grasp enzyme n=1 Tax=Gomphosphaeria aponina SAG 52.96 = DSM 107014 TaxID=1521640 RepID=A0A941GMW5_9CHRO|nr:ATP-grasp enzyme [Gomphosphaeria aponina SAG 52.96 = DSM 107014]
MNPILFIVQKKAIALFQNLGTLTLLLLAFPFNLLLVCTSLILNFLRTPLGKKVVAKNPKNILITGGKMTKALQLARSFHAAGHRVFLVETPKYWLSGHRFSQAVANLYTVPAPEKDPDGYCQGLLAIVKGEKIDLFIPVSSPVASYYDSLAKPILAPDCEVLHFDPDITKMLDNKFTLCTQASELGLTAPKVFFITNPQQILDFDFTAQGSKYILKSLRYDSVTRLDLTQLPFEGMEEYVKKLPISEERPWVMQEFITGQEYCTHSTVRNGKIRLHCCSKSSPFQVNYEEVDKPEIYQWVEEFVGKLNLTGQISFDFIQTEEGTVYPVECNPRTHSAITMFHDHPGVANAYLDARDEPAIKPLPNSKPTYWLYHELWRLNEISSLSDLQAWIDKIVKGTDAIFRVDDPLPFLMVHHWQIPLLLLDNLRKLKGWVRIDFNIGKLVELGGD